MPRLIVELDTDLYRMLQEAARINQLSLQEECVRRLVGGGRRSRYMEALLAELRADDAQRRAQRG
ncbi:hypothetical protein [Ectopseudomonas oleovorans]|uniref:Uncharacterized protein n=1 Tax=Ectopseudomonas oleovorans TaxID=301 RepID=A0A427HUP8_ECTOL|nr:hypothetical protein [Pseudomonas oleovorans]RRW38706.1 hypothetical protein EGJ44_02655 [Pseudomonas oleovorans]